MTVEKKTPKGMLIRNLSPKSGSFQLSSKDFLAAIFKPEENLTLLAARMRISRPMTLTLPRGAEMVMPVKAEKETEP